LASVQSAQGGDGAALLNDLHRVHGDDAHLARLIKILRQRLDVRTQQCSIVYRVPRGLTLDYSFADPCAFDSAATVAQSLSKGMGGFRVCDGSDCGPNNVRPGGYNGLITL
jgi:hypothetical protein